MAYLMERKLVVRPAGAYVEGCIVLSLSRHLGLNIRQASSVSSACWELSI